LIVIMDLRLVFAANLRRLRSERGFSQCQLAVKAGLNRSYLSQLENGRNDARLKLIGKLADVLGVKASELLTLEEPKHPETEAPGK
jgi:transcriptional regulator with XRE-family HTH domain